MIESISLRNVASYPAAGESLAGLKPVNIVYGSNGSGKTTLSRAIAGATGCEDCTLAWNSGQAHRTEVYNRDFVKAHLDDTGDVPGVFTLGKQSIEKQKEVEAEEEKLANLAMHIGKTHDQLGKDDDTSGTRAELKDVEEELDRLCWEERDRHQEELKPAFAGYLTSRRKLRERLVELLTHLEGDPPLLPELHARAARFFGEPPEQTMRVQAPEAAALLQMSGEPLLTKRLVGSGDTPLSEAISRLNADAWVRRGTELIATTDGRCPLCQQVLPPSLAEQLRQHFDAAFAEACAELASFEQQYRSRTTQIISGFKAAGESTFLDDDGYRLQLESLRSSIEKNLQLLEQKIADPSLPVTLQSLEGPIAELRQTIMAANATIDRQNDDIEQRAAGAKQLTSDVWHLMAFSVRESLTAQVKKKAELESKIAGLKASIKSDLEAQAACRKIIRTIKASLSGIQRVADGINGLLIQHGFTNFRLECLEDSGRYRLLRDDGSAVEDTLSEGERSFVTFLYFFHYLKGSHQVQGSAGDRIVVIDDPVSSLDSGVLFVVGTLVQQLIKGVHAKGSGIRQIFVLTHNVYFHKEVSYGLEGGKVKMEKIPAHFLIRKHGSVSRVKACACNPINTDYEMMWRDVADPDCPPHSVRNSMRRILETYFTHLGGYSLRTLGNDLDEQDQVACATLLKGLHDGSHHIHDGLHVAIDSKAVDQLKALFRGIFETEGHLPHYEMMMKRAEAGLVKEAVN